MGVQVYIFRDSIYIVGRRVKVCINFNCVGIATGRISLPYCYCMIIVTEHIGIFTDSNMLRLSLSIRVKFEIKAFMACFVLSLPSF